MKLGAQNIEFKDVTGKIFEPKGLGALFVLGVVGRRVEGSIMAPFGHIRNPE